MPYFEAATLLSHPAARVFDFLSVPANLIAVTPPELNMCLVEAPERLFLGARVVLQARYWQFSQRLVSEVTGFEPDRLLVDEQREGPFRKWIHSHRLQAVPQGTRMTECVEFEPPGGVLGWMLSAETMLHELEEMFAYREQRFKELLSGKAAPHP
jgi:ligand-binding SRPBCC domain-containing protein